MNKHELYHSEIYLGKDFSDGFKHYKYLKKVKSANGKWRYIYDESEEKNMQKAINKEYKQISDKDGNVRYRDANNKIVTKNMKSDFKLTNALTLPEVLGKRTSSDKVKEIRLNRVREAQKIHNKQKMKDIPKKILAKGVGAVGNLLMKIDSKIAAKKPKDTGTYTRNSVVNNQPAKKPTLVNQRELQIKKKKK